MTEHNTVKETLDSVKAELETLQKEIADKEAEEQFNERMASLDDNFELTDEDREVIAADIKDLNEEDYESYNNKMNVLLKNKLKSEIEKANAEASEEVKASTDAEEVIETAVDEANKETEELPNSTTPEEPTTQEKYQQAFSIAEFEINY